MQKVNYPSRSTWTSRRRHRARGRTPGVRWRSPRPSSSAVVMKPQPASVAGGARAAGTGARTCTLRPTRRLARAGRAGAATRPAIDTSRPWARVRCPCPAKPRLPSPSRRHHLRPPRQWRGADRRQHEDPTTPASSSPTEKHGALSSKHYRPAARSRCRPRDEVPATQRQPQSRIRCATTRRLRRPQSDSGRMATHRVGARPRDVETDGEPRSVPDLLSGGALRGRSPARLAWRQANFPIPDVDSRIPRLQPQPGRCRAADLRLFQRLGVRPVAAEYCMTY